MKTQDDQCAEAISVLRSELERAFSSYEKAEEAAELKSLAVKSAMNEFEIAKKNIDVCINRHDRLQQAIEILTGKQDSIFNLKNRFVGNIEAEANQSTEKEAPTPDYGSCALPPRSTPIKDQGIMSNSMRVTDPDKDLFLRNVVSWYLSLSRGCEFVKIQDSIAFAFPDREKAKYWLEHVLEDGISRKIVERVRRGVYRLVSYSEVRNGGGSYRVVAFGKPTDVFVDLAPGLEREDAVKSIIMRSGFLVGLIESNSFHGEFSCQINSKNKTIMVTT